MDLIVSVWVVRMNIFGKHQKNAKRRKKMTPNNDFLDNLANDQYQKLIQEVYNDDMLKKTTKNKNNNELIERIEEDDSSEGKQVL
jgi:hypothetical protein